MAAPERIGRYAVLGEIGHGAMGTVYRALDEALDREVALKVMSAGLGAAEDRARFLREARAAARLAHPNIVVIYELGEHEGAPFMALELLQGIDLQHGIDAGVRPDPRATLPLVLQLLAGLAHAHEHGIVHRDVKPSNLFLPLGQPAKIMDFGVARLAGSSTTRSGTVLGTPSYMSPEQFAGGELDGRSDLFSAGLILYELVTGEKAVKADSVVAAMYKITHETPDLGQIPRGERWEPLRGVLARALERKPQDRWPDAKSMGAALAEALLALGGSPDLAAPSEQALLVRPRPLPRAERPSATASAPAPPRRAPAARPAPPEAPERSRTWRVLGAAALTLALAAGAWLALARPPASTPAGGASPPGPLGSRLAPEPSRPPAAASAAPATTLATPPAPASPAAAVPTPASKPKPHEDAASAEPGATQPEPAALPGLDPATRLVRARDLLERDRFREALAEARAVLEREPGNREAARLAQEAEAELVVEDCLRAAREALREGDRERALEEVRRGFLVRKSDPRLLAMHREVLSP
jgi:eukaryotic-like serine/threonine-protein kinase